MGGCPEEGNAVFAMDLRSEKESSGGGAINPKQKYSGVGSRRPGGNTTGLPTTAMATFLVHRLRFEAG